MRTTVIARVAGALAVAAALAAGSAHLRADDPTAVVILMDKSALDYGPPPHAIPADAVNTLIAAVGVRDQLPYFKANVGKLLTLPTGLDGTDGWFTLASVPSNWSTQAN